jgi:hypothetical protein
VSFFIKTFNNFGAWKLGPSFDVKRHWEFFIE